MMTSSGLFLEICPRANEDISQMFSQFERYSMTSKRTFPSTIGGVPLTCRSLFVWSDLNGAVKATNILFILYKLKFGLPFSASIYFRIYFYSFHNLKWPITCLKHAEVFGCRCGLNQPKHPV